MTIGDAINGVMNMRNGRMQLANAKRRLLDRLSMEQLQGIYDKYCYVEPKEISQQNMTGIDLLKIVTQPGTPNNRKKFIQAISQQVSWDTLKVWAKDNKVDIKDIGM